MKAGVGGLIQLVAGVNGAAAAWLGHEPWVICRHACAGHAAHGAGRAGPWALEECDGAGACTGATNESGALLSWTGHAAHCFTSKPALSRQQLLLVVVLGVCAGRRKRIEARAAGASCRWVERSCVGMGRINLRAT